METSLIGQEAVTDILKKVIDDPPHIFITGAYGSGKTTLLREFIATYFTKKGTKPQRESILWLSSEQDRGIHCIRQSVTEFVKHTSNTPGTYRWIVIDDADSLPIISQQALRRPMETYTDSTRFIFSSRYKGDLIQPLFSRCMYVETSVVPPSQLFEHFAKLYDAPNLTFSTGFVNFSICTAKTNTEIRNMMRILCSNYRDKGTHELTDQDLLTMFSAPSFSLCYKLLEAYIRKDRDQTTQIFMDLWKTGMSYEDFLQELDISFQTMKYVPSHVSQEIHEMLIKGWMNFAQGKTHTLDMMRLFFRA
jgi:replication factor C subunit 2/4